MRKRILLVLSAVLIVPFWLSTASALMLSIDDGNDGIDITVEDNDGIDQDSRDGVLQYSTALNTWSVLFNLGLSYPEVGSFEEPRLHLNSVEVSSGTAGGVLKIQLSDIYGPIDSSVTGFYSRIGGLTDGSVLFNVYMNNSLETTFTGVNAFSDMQSFDFISGNLTDEFMIEAIITHNAGDVTSFDADIAPVPEPGTLLLLGSGLAGLAAARRRKKA